jgi:hypothetical protein
MRFATLALLLLFPSLTCVRAFAIDERIVDPVAMAALMARADQAQPKEQCFLSRWCRSMRKRSTWA